MLGGLMNATGLCCDEQRHVSNQPMFLIHQKSALDDPLPTTKNTHSHEIHLQTSPQVPPQTTNKNDGTVTPPKEPDNEATRQRGPAQCRGNVPVALAPFTFPPHRIEALLVSGVAYFLFVRDYQTNRPQDAELAAPIWRPSVPEQAWRCRGISR